MAITLLSSIPQVADLRTDWVAAHAGQPERILSAIGHPGYGRAYARRVLAHMAASGASAHQAIYGRR